MRFEPRDIFATTFPNYELGENFSAPNQDAHYPSALANSIAGNDLSPGAVDFVIFFDCNTNWYTGLDGQPLSNQADLVSVALHEIIHGLLGLSGLVSMGGRIAPRIPVLNSNDEALPSIIDFFITGCDTGPLGNVLLSVGEAFISNFSIISEETNFGESNYNIGRLVLCMLAQIGYQVNFINEPTSIGIGDFIPPFWRRYIIKFRNNGEQQNNRTTAKLRINNSMDENRTEIIYDGLYTYGRKIIITDISGKVIKSHKLAESSGKLRISNLALNSGIYLVLAIEKEKIVASERFLIIKLGAT